jgi:Transglutaminase-like superfamily
MRTALLLYLIGWMVCFSVSGSQAQEAALEPASPPTKKAKAAVEADPQAKIELWSTRKLKMRFGMQFLSNDNNCTQLFATIPFPKEWDEQKVTILSAELPDNAKYKEREIPGGAKQLVLTVPALGPQQQLDVVVTIEIEKSFINPPKAPETLVFPKKTLKDKDLNWYLGDSPMIDTKSAQVRSIIKSLKDAEPEHAWAYVESIYDWVRTNINYRQGELRSTKDTLKDKFGDCEEMSGLFVALCRASNIPARCVWIPDHCYPEFYLEDANGFGHWYPCQVAGDRQFGQMQEYRPILQKGDRFKVPESKGLDRYIAEKFTCKHRVIGPKEPSVSIIRDLGELQAELATMQAATEPKAAAPVSPTP